jgi:AcrR family transcriptional regulator
MTNPMTHQSHPARVDRRIERTRRALRDALLALITEKGYDAVTVEDITERANLGRATFYLHYRDKEEVLLEQFIELARDRVRLLSEIPLAGWDEERNPIYLPLLLVFENAAQNAAIYRVVLQGEGAARITARIRDIIVGVLSELLQRPGDNAHLAINPQAPIDFLANYLAGALIGSIAWWLEQSEPPAPEAMTRLFQRMFFPGAIQVIGLEGH